MMFSQSLSHDPREARAALQRFMAFLELEAERGQLSRSIEKKVLGELSSRFIYRVSQVKVHTCRRGTPCI